MKSHNYFLKTILFNIVIITTLRLIEILLIYKNFGIDGGWFTNEIIGLGVDILLTSALLTLAYPFHLLLFRKKRELGNRIMVIAITALGVVHLIIIKYFLYQLTPLDNFLYQYPLKEIILTVTTTETSYTSLILSIITLTITSWISTILLKRYDFSKKTAVYIYSFIAVAVIITIGLVATGLLFSNKFIQNKPIYFYARSVNYFIKSANDDKYSKENTIQYQETFRKEEYTSKEFPLLHTFDSTDVVGRYFKKASKAPNIVILIVEGLNDDFVHTYHGVNIMPFLTKLKENSLYWNSCFTLGERSFAVVPSILGGLPYGETGFLLEKNLPYHLSLASILKANNYYISFFYGQGSWFHQKARFFEYNHADLVFDDSRFEPKYKKIIVGKDKFFWGYHDKPLFNQSLDVIDTLPKKSRLDVYFTGTSHGAYNEKESVYSGKLARYTQKTNDPEFFKTYGSYLKSLFYVDDALEEFFHNYQKRADYTNTIFIITGDHPITQMPRSNSLKRYHVPLIIYSPLLNKAEEFSNIVSHLDVYETLLAFLHTNYKISIPKYSTSLGDKLIPNKKTIKKIAFMDDNREIIDYYSDGYYIAGNTNLYRVGKGFALTPTTDPERLQAMQYELNVFKKTSRYVCMNDKIISPTQYYEALLIKPLLFIDEKKEVAVKTEFHDLTDAIPIQNKGVTFHASFNYTGPVAKNSILVYQLTNKRDSTILWQSNSLLENKNKLSIQVKIPTQNTEDSILKFKAYIWNQKRLNINYSNLRLLLY